MKLRKGARILLWSGGILMAALAALYLLRWPLFGGLLRSKMAELAGKELRADLDVGDLGGSLLWSIHGRGAVLKPRPGAPFRSAQVERIDVEYGFLGSGEPRITVDGARFVLAPKEGPAPPLHETVRDVVSVLRSLRFPGAVSATRVEAVLPDGRSVKLDRGTLEQGRWTVSLKTAGLGTIEGAATLLPDGALTLEGRASEGKVRTAKLELGSGDQCPLRISTEIDGHPLTWAGTASFSKGRLDRVDGELQVKEGRARTRADFVTGRVEADVDAVLALDEEFKGDLAVTARAEGPMVGPAEAWTLREGRVRTKDARFRAIVIDEADVTLGAGSLAKVSLKATARSGRDQVRAEGDFGWDGKQPDVDARIDVSADEAAPYLGLLKEPLPLKAKALRAEGTLRIREGAVSYDGSVSIGAGEYHGHPWEALRFQGSLSPDRIVAREVVLTNSSFAASMTASGKLEGETLTIQFSSDRDRGELEGRFHKATGDFEGRLRLEGPMTWLDRGFGIQLPGEFNPLRLEGTLRHEKEDTALRVDVTGKEGCSIVVSATLRKKEDDWIVAVAPGALMLPTRKVTYDAFVFSLTNGKASLENLKLTCTEPPLAARVSGSATWDRKETKVLFHMQDTSVYDVSIDALFARVTIDTATKEADVNLHWGKEDGDHFHVEGRWGKEIDLTAELRAGDLKRPLVRHFFPGVVLEGSLGASAHVTGGAEDPQVSGTVTLTKVSTAGLPPISLVIPLQSAKNGLRFWCVEEKTPYGSLTIDGTVPLSGSEAPLDLSVGLMTDDLSPFLDRLTPQARIWIPHGGLAVNVGLHGPVSKPALTGRAEFSMPLWKPPAPLPEAQDIRIVARLDADGIAFDMVDGLLGKGPFWASGRWDAFRPGTPLSLWITGRDALAIADPLARMRVKPDVTLTWTQGDYVRLSGRVEVPLAIYHREFAAATPGGTRVATRQVAPPRLRLIPGESGGFLIPGIEGLEGLELDLHVVTTGEFRIENSVAGVLLQAEGQLTGTGAEPAVNGVIRTVQRHGEVKLAPGNFLRVDYGEAVLPEELGRVPTIRFEGHVGVGEGMIQVRVEGPLDNPALTLNSDPPQPQKDLLGKLAFGLGTGSFSSETGVATLAVYIYSQAQDDWPSADRKEGILERFRPQVVAPYDATRRKPWELPPQGTLRSTALRTEYVLNDYFSIIAETNREGDVGGDLKLRIRF
jgi:autotransporter translocation and assembly factor TamB